MRFALQEKAIADACQVCVRGCLDATGIGQQMAERMQEQFGSRIEPVHFTLQVKQDLAVRARRLFEERRIRIPDYAPLRRDLSSVKRLITPAGNVRYDADRTDAGHADRFWALALALAAADSGVAAAALGVDPVAEFGLRHAELPWDRWQHPVPLAVTLAAPLAPGLPGLTGRGGLTFWKGREGTAA